MLKSIIKNFLTINNYYLFNNRYNFHSKFINNFFNLLFIYDCGHELKRIGNLNDGGYLIPNILNEIEFNISPGVGLCTAFENDLLQYGIKSFLIDGTVDYNGKHFFLKKNLSAYNDSKNITLNSFIANNSTINKSSNLMLQMDIEGAEIENLLSVTEETLKKFKVLVIEFHDFESLNNISFLKLYHSVFIKILKYFTIIHIHPNNFGKVVDLNNKKIPDIMEFTFIRNDLMRYKKNIKYSLPHLEDKKNSEKDDDLALPETFYKNK
jgi:hypothetical protein